jgi:uncharacterized protein (DUF2267 family)
MPRKTPPPHPIPAFLATRSAAKTAPARATATAAPPATPSATKPAPPPSSPAKHDPTPHNTTKPAKQARGGNRSGRRRATNPVAAAADTFEALADRVAEESADQAAAQIVRPHLPEVLRALVVGASVPGSAGVADRSLLLRIMRHSSSTAREQAQAARQLGQALGDRLVSAMSKRDGAMRRVLEGQSEPIGRAGVTLPTPIREEA